MMFCTWIIKSFASVTPQCGINGFIKALPPNNIIENTKNEIELLDDSVADLSNITCFTKF